MTQRRDFLKMLCMSAVASVLPEVQTTELKTEKITINTTSNFGYEGIGVGSVERIRITSNGSLTLADVSPSANIKIF